MLVRRNNLLNEMLREMDLFGGRLQSDINYYFDENDESYDIHLSLPGMDKSDIKIELDGNYLNISSEKKEESEKSYFYKSFEKRVKISNHIDVDNISSKMDKGILTLTLPKKEVKSSKKVIEVK